MANGILKGLAVAAGTGIAVGFGSGRARVRTLTRQPAAETAHTRTADPTPAGDADEDFLNIEPLLDRLERVEARIESMEQRPSPVHTASSAPDGFAAAIADLERRVEENTRDLALLRERVTDAERRVAESVTSVQAKVEQTRAELPAFVERSVTAGMDHLRTRIAAEMEQSHQRTLATFERTIDEKISSRIGSMERSLAEQAGSIEALRTRATETDTNLQRLVVAIEKLCDRAQFAATVPDRQPAPIEETGGKRQDRPPHSAAIQEPRQYETRLPFESQLHDALRREPVVPVLKTEDDPAVDVPAPTFASTPAPKQSAGKRFLFFNLIVAGLVSLLASRSGR